MKTREVVNAVSRDARGINHPASSLLHYREIKASPPIKAGHQPPHCIELRWWRQFDALVECAHRIASWTFHSYTTRRGRPGSDALHSAYFPGQKLVRSAGKFARSDVKSADVDNKWMFNTVDCCADSRWLDKSATGDCFAEDTVYRCDFSGAASRKTRPGCNEVGTIGRGRQITELSKLRVIIDGLLLSNYIINFVVIIDHYWYYHLLFLVLLIINDFIIACVSSTVMILNFDRIWQTSNFIVFKPFGGTYYTCVFFVLFYWHFYWSHDRLYDIMYCEK